jgi:hypothetical protein
VLKKTLFLIVILVIASSTWVAAGDPRGERSASRRAAADTPGRHSPAVDGDPVFATAGGWTYSAWAYRSDGEFSIAISYRDVYNGWSDPIYVGLSDGLDQIDPALVSDDLGNLYLAYSVPQSGEIWMTAKWTARASWFVPQRISIGADIGGTPALDVIGDRVVLAFRSELSGVRIKDWPGLPAQPLGFNTDGIQEGPDGFPLNGLTHDDGTNGQHDIIDDRDENTTSDNNNGGSMRARSNGGTGR